MKKPIIALTIIALIAGAWWVVGTQHEHQAAVTKPAPASQPAVEAMPGLRLYVNDYRVSKGLKPLALEAHLDKSSQAKADDLVAKHYWSHVSPDGTQPWAFIQKAGYGYTHAGENLAKCYASPDAIVKAWIASPKHEAILRGDFTEIGFGVAHNPKNNCNYVVGHFGRR